MSLNKAIKSGKEHRVEYGTKGQPYCKSVDHTCRNHGGRAGGAKNQCPYCLGNRLYQYKKEEEKSGYKLKEFEDGDKKW